MTSLEKPELATTNVRYRMPSIHREGYKYVATSAALSLLFLTLISDEIGGLLVIVTLWVISFFRDPIRTTPRGERFIVSPADGLVTMIADVPIPRELAGQDALGSGTVTRVSIFMSVFDVHINRTPIGGTIKRVVYISGKFLNADLDKASEENERQHILVEARDGLRVGFTQIAGLVARRIVPFVKPGDIVATGQRIGLIRFGSRVDVFLPAGTAPRVILGQRALAGETVIAEAGNAAPASGISQ